MLDIYNTFKGELDKFPFLIIIGKYDQILGPRALFSSFPLANEDFVRNLLRDALNTKNKFVILDFNNFYCQVCKIEVEDPSARGRKQLYALILLRHVELPLIPIIHFKRIEMMFHKIGNDKILLDDIKAFEIFFEKIKEIYMKKDELLPLESKNLQIRSGINTIKGFCELILEQKKEYEKLSMENVISYVEMMVDACNDIMDAIENGQKNTLVK